jgi:hypothetical protein
MVGLPIAVISNMMSETSPMATPRCAFCTSAAQRFVSDEVTHSNMLACMHGISEKCGRCGEKRARACSHACMALQRAL